MEKYKLHNRTIAKPQGGNEIVFETYYPLENPDGAMEIVVRAMAKCGLFDGSEEV